MQASLIPLRRFWETLETNFPLGGVRKSLIDTLEHPLVEALERSSIFSFQRQSETYPCPKPGGNGCPRLVRKRRDGQIVAICGNHPPECENVILSAKETELIGVTPEQLIVALRDALLIGGTDAIETKLPHVFRAGTYVPAPGIRHSIYFAVRCGEEDYATVFDVLRSRSEGQGIAVLIPTDRFLSAEAARQMGHCGIPVLPLSDVIDLDHSGHLVCAVAPEQLFGRIGQRMIETGGVASPAYAWAQTNDGGKSISAKQYEELAASAQRYTIFVDQFTQIVEKGMGKARTRRTNVPLAYFDILRRAIETRGYFDPTNSDHVGKEMESSKQTFQRARQAVDIARQQQGHRTWALFKTLKVDRRAVYHFQTDPDVSFAMIFSP